MTPPRRLPRQAKAPPPPPAPNPQSSSTSDSTPIPSSLTIQPPHLNRAHAPTPSPLQPLTSWSYCQRFLTLLVLIIFVLCGLILWSGYRRMISELAATGRLHRAARRDTEHVDWRWGAWKELKELGCAVYAIHKS